MPFIAAGCKNAGIEVFLDKRELRIYFAARLKSQNFSTVKPMLRKLARYCCLTILFIGGSLLFSQKSFGLEITIADDEGERPRTATASVDIPFAADRIAERFSGIVDLGDLVPDLLFTSFIAEQTANELDREPPQTIVEMFDRAEAGQVAVHDQNTLYLLALFDFPPPIRNRWGVLKIRKEQAGADEIIYFEKFAGDLFNCAGGIRLTPVGAGQSNLAISLRLVPEETSGRDFEDFVIKTFLPNIYAGLSSRLKAPAK